VVRPLAEGAQIIVPFHFVLAQRFKPPGAAHRIEAGKPKRKAAGVDAVSYVATPRAGCGPWLVCARHAGDGAQ
jgi:hypothetical protein